MLYREINVLVESNSTDTARAPTMQRRREETKTGPVPDLRMSPCSHSFTNSFIHSLFLKISGIHSFMNPCSLLILIHSDKN